MSTPEESPALRAPGQSQLCRNVLSLIEVLLGASLVSDYAELFSVCLIATCLSSFHIFPTFLLYCLFLSFDYLA